MENRYIVVFDGVCNLCNKAVNFVIERDPDCLFCFAPMQSNYAQALMLKHEIFSTDIDTFLLVKDEQCFVFSSAALEIAKHLNGYWYLFKVFKIIPARLRDYVYKALARQRYKLFGKANVCRVPSEQDKHRFISA